MNIDAIWNNIKHCEGEEFKTVRGIEFQYVVYNDYILINDDRKRKVTKAGMKKALLIVNPTPAKIQKAGLWGSSYIYGIIADNRMV